MATGGTGDILTGIVAGIIAQNSQCIFEAVIAAVYLHGLAGDIARDFVGEQPLVATDLIKTVPEAIRRIQAQAAEKPVKI
jgi:NAD(P)H-hydrate epimerase